ncbi:MAG: hypothetical protein S4CHLAM6_09810 [Chlamydiae bacterium]|nr:hypothetical protein [Chlamydiota bacterium]
MNASISPYTSNETALDLFDLPSSEPFAKDIQNDPELYFYLVAFIKAAPSQLQKIDELYFYEKLEMGDLLEAVAEGPTRVTIEQAKQMVKSLAKCSFFKEEKYTLHKVCKGHFDEIAKRRQPFRNAEHVDKVEQKILHEWQEKKEIKSDSIQIKQIIARNLFWTRRFCDFYISYTHVDNYLGCSFPSVKKWSTHNRSFSSVVEQFENKVKNSHLNGNLEWSKLAERVFGNNIIFAW